MSSPFMKEYEHSPLAKLDYGFNWSTWLGAAETITVSNWEVTTGMVMTTPQVASGVTSVFLEGGVVGTAYYLKNTITTSAGRVDSRTVKILCKNR